MNWNYVMSLAPRDGVSKVVIAVTGSRKVRWCVWNKTDGRWSGLLAGEVPLCFVTVTHPNAENVKLPEGVKL